MNINTVNRFYSGHISGINDTVQRLPNVEIINSYTVIAPSSNVGPIFLGPVGVSVQTGFPLYPSAGISFNTDNLNYLNIIGTSGSNNDLMYIGS